MVRRPHAGQRYSVSFLTRFPSSLSPNRNALGVAISCVSVHASQTRFIEVLRRGIAQAAQISGRHVTLFGLTPRGTKSAYAGNAQRAAPLGLQAGCPCQRDRSGECDRVDATVAYAERAPSVGGHCRTEEAPGQNMDGIGLGERGRSLYVS